jgi:hypothetical protein
VNAHKTRSIALAAAAALMFSTLGVASHADEAK